LVQLLERLSAQPTQSIPAACRGWAETQAAYRFLHNERVEAVDILDGHSRATLQRIACEPVVLILQDTTFLEYVTERARHGFGTLRRTVKDEYLRHPSVAFTPERVNLGVLGHHCWQRPEEPIGHQRKHRPLEAKESQRWLRGYELACQVQRHCPQTLVINMADREGDIHDWCLEATNRPAPERAAVIIRAKCNRRVQGMPTDSYLWEPLGQTPELGTLTLALPRRPGRGARQATLRVCARAVPFNGARRPGGKFPPVEVYTVYVKEEQPPVGEEALAWRLRTTLVVEDFVTAQAVSHWYRARWEIARYFRMLTQGCRIEDRR
jgi:hypothetical protein